MSPKNQFAPVANLDTYGRLDPEALGNYHLLIATEVAKDPQAWHEFWIEKDDQFIILDNGLIETGRADDIEAMKVACDAIEPDCVVLPDVLGDAAATFEQSARLLPEYVKLGYPIMGVVQGKTVDEVETLLKFYVDSNLQYVSIPRVMTRIFGTRRHLVERVRWRKLPIHLLGWSDNVADDLHCAAMNDVMGIDSAVPFWYKGGQFPEAPPREAMWGSRPDDYWERKLTEPQMLIAQYNVKWVRSWLKLLRVES